MIKFFGIDVGKKSILRALFGWSLWLPSKKDSAKPFDGKITSTEKEDESWADPLDIAEDSILRQTDPLHMTIRESYESTVRYWMERKGYGRKEIEKPLTDERLKAIGRSTFNDYYQFQKGNRKKVLGDEGFAGLALPIEDGREVG
jgi:hypothetical protein